MRLKKEKRAARTLAKRSGRKRPSKNALGYALAGYTNSFGAGSYDFWLVKTDSSGSMMWNQTYGGSGDDEAGCVIQTSDGGYALVGFTASYGARARHQCNITILQFTITKNANKKRRGPDNTIYKTTLQLTFQMKIGG